jgi:TrmH family RNA methyltransferase
MVPKSELQLIKKLNQKKYRTLEQKFVVEGKRLTSEGLKSNYNLVKIYITNDFLEREPLFENYLNNFKQKVEIIKKSEFLKITSTENPQGIAAVFEIPHSQSNINLGKTVVYLENISDPGNLGTILRSCNWFGIKTIFLSQGCADLYNPKVLRSSMGAIFYLDVFENFITNEITNDFRSKGYKTLFADMDGIDYRKVDYSEKLFISFCNEAFGPSEELIKNSDHSITIPKRGEIDSLNVAAAAAVILSQTI